jgi:hypothetical protein
MLTIHNRMKVAFGYKMGVGKDSAVSYLVQKHGGKHISFAKPIYDILHYAQKKCGFPVCKDRHFLQYVGTEWGRSHEENVWVRLALESVELNENNFISDLRYLNEFKALKDSGWKCVKISRRVEKVGKEREGTGSSYHSSEVELDKVREEEWDYIISNDSDLEEFYGKIDEMVYHIYSI